MWHRIKFVRACLLGVAQGPNRHLERVIVAQAQTFSARLRPYVITTGKGRLVEVADVDVEGGDTFLAVPYAWFTFDD